jgi:hypothetical protein
LLTTPYNSQGLQIARRIDCFGEIAIEHEPGLLTLRQYLSNICEFQVSVEFGETDITDTDKLLDPSSGPLVDVSTLPNAKL